MQQESREDAVTAGLGRHSNKLFGFQPQLLASGQVHRQPARGHLEPEQTEPSSPVLKGATISSAQVGISSQTFKHHEVDRCSAYLSSVLPKVAEGRQDGVVQLHQHTQLLLQ